MAHMGPPICFSGFWVGGLLLGDEEGVYFFLKNSRLAFPHCRVWYVGFIALTA